ncbi:DgyrCDS7866 [Dimorphilus gyrociliatus]|uniref:DgyrCDS7866 n=1 Tax=Dimorphilus gyrociliatus TaxID=2664684 RepID=A0A7I8VUV5_9ANNE|nr:DgyrCDS7866 [Dimorphilus gyrociliatus]
MIRKLNALPGFDTRTGTYIKVSIAQSLQEISGDYKAKEKCKMEYSQFLPKFNDDFTIGEFIKIQGSLFKMDSKTALVCAKNIRKISEKEVEQHLRIAEKLKIDVYDKDFILREELDAFNNLEGLFKFHFGSKILKFIEEEITSFKTFDDELIIGNLLCKDTKNRAVEYIQSERQSFRVYNSGNNNKDDNDRVTELFKEIIQDALKHLLEEGKLYKISDSEFLTTKNDKVLYKQIIDCLPASNSKEGIHWKSIMAKIKNYNFYITKQALLYALDDLVQSATIFPCTNHKYKLV